MFRLCETYGRVWAMFGPENFKHQFDVYCGTVELPTVEPHILEDKTANQRVFRGNDATIGK